MSYYSLFTRYDVFLTCDQQIPKELADKATYSYKRVYAAGLTLEQHV
jgi:hypothetical protein